MLILSVPSSVPLSTSRGGVVAMQSQPSSMPIIAYGDHVIQQSIGNDVGINSTVNSMGMYPYMSVCICYSDKR